LRRDLLGYLETVGGPMKRQVLVVGYEHGARDRSERGELAVIGIFYLRESLGN
jgi:hypothetical protein